MTEVWVMIESTTDPFLIVHPFSLAWLLVTKYCLLPMGWYKKKLNKVYQVSLGMGLHEEKRKLC